MVTLCDRISPGWWILSLWNSLIDYWNTWFVRPWVVALWKDTRWVMISDHWTWDGAQWAAYDLCDHDLSMKFHVFHKSAFPVFQDVQY